MRYLAVDCFIEKYFEDEPTWDELPTDVIYERQPVQIFTNSAELIWGPDLETNNTILCRVTVEAP